MSDDRPAPERHLHWEFLAHDGPEDQTGDIHWAVTVDVIGYEREADALIGAQAIVQRATWKLRRVWECPSCGFQAKAVAAMQKMTG